jgi:hypothetical protein
VIGDWRTPRGFEIRVVIEVEAWETAENVGAPTFKVLL